MPSYETVGGRRGHYARRGIHFSIFAIALLFYLYILPRVENSFILLMVLIGAIVFIVALDFIRIHFHLIFFGQRKHEADNFSSFAWTMCALFIVFSLASPKFGLPIVASVAFVDPVLGELRARFNRSLAASVGFIIALSIWLYAAYLFHFVWWYAPIIAAVIILVEYPRLRWIDDNALMLLVPLPLVLLLHGSL